MHLFVYGTLMRGGGLNSLLKDAEFISKATTHEAIFDLHTGGGYPCLIEGEHKIEGELYDIPTDLLPRLDRAEGYPHLYKRDSITLGQDGATEALVYTYHDYHMDAKRRYKGPLIALDSDRNTKHWVG